MFDQHKVERTRASQVRAQYEQRGGGGGGGGGGGTDFSTLRGSGAETVVHAKLYALFEASKL